MSKLGILARNIGKCVGDPRDKTCKVFGREPGSYIRPSLTLRPS